MPVTARVFFVHASSHGRGAVRLEGSATRERERDCCSEEEIGSTGKGTKDLLNDNLLEIKFVSGPILEKNSPHVLSYTM